MSVEISKKKFSYRSKPKEDDFFFSWFIQRRIAKPLVILLSPTGITPNQISVLTIFVGFVGIFFLLNGKPINDLIGIIILHFAAILDCVDGDLARTRQIEDSLTGRFADYIKVVILDPLIPISLAIGLVNQGASVWWMVGIVVASFWKIAPQFTREHVVMRTLDKKPELVSQQEAIPLFRDPQQSLGDKSSETNFFQLGIRLIKLIIGLPNALLNTIFVLSVVGIVFLSIEKYIVFKEILVCFVIISYVGFFIKALTLEISNLRHCDRK